MTTAFWILVLLSLLLFGGFALISIREGERRAVRISVIFACIGCGVSGVGAFLPASFQTIILLIVMGGGVLAFILFLLPIGSVDRLRDVPARRFDERDIMFARARLQPGSERYNAYYAIRSENEAVDNQFRAQPGLLSPDAKYADPMLFAASEPALR